MKVNVFKSLSSSLLIVVTIFLFSCVSRNKKTEVNEKPILVFAAASLTDVLSEIVDSFQVKYKVEVKTNMASSGTLARQIEQGGGADVYISASKKWAAYVDSLGFIKKDFTSNIAKNELVLIAPLKSERDLAVIDSSLNFVSLLGDGRLSMGDPSHVPAGKYAKQSLEYFGWYSQLQNKILPAKDVRSALKMVEMEESPVGIVYHTDAQKSKKVKVLKAFPERSHKPIEYIAGVCIERQASKDFFSYLNSNETNGIWKKYGFIK